MKRNWISYPYIVWMLIFIAIPLMLIVYYSFTIETEEGIRFTFENIRKCMDPIYLNVLLKSILLALISTAICLVIGYPAALILASREFSRKRIMVLLIIVPMWFNFLLRTYAWMTLLDQNGIINTILGWLHLPEAELLYTNQAVIVGMIYNFLPFMVLPIYSTLSKMDKSLLEAAEDLGGNKAVVFRRVILPMSLPGVMSGITMVFMPAVTTFVIPKLLGGGQYTLIGNLIEKQFLLVSDWNFGSALSFILMVIILISMAVMSRLDKDREEGALW